MSDLFKATPGSTSEMRVMSFICGMVACTIAIAGTVIWAIKGSDLAGIIGLVSSLAGFAFTGKAIQSFAENKTTTSLIEVPNEEVKQI